MKVRIEITYQVPKGAETIFSSDEMSVEKAIAIAEDLKKIGRAKIITFTDNLENKWSMKELKKFIQGIQTDPHNVTVYFDGGFDRNSYKAGLGCAIYFDQNGKSFRLRKNASVQEIDTNNEAEYAAFHFALQELELLGVHHLPVTFIGDSQVVINQLNGEWPCYEAELSKWINRIENHLNLLGITPNYEQVSRKRNREADHLASQALHDIEIISTIEIQK